MSTLLQTPLFANTDAVPACRDCREEPAADRDSGRCRGCQAARDLRRLVKAVDRLGGQAAILAAAALEAITAPAETSPAPWRPARVNLINIALRIATGPDDELADDAAYQLWELGSFRDMPRRSVEAVRVVKDPRVGSDRDRDDD